MALYQRGSQGPEIAKVQTLGFYAGPIDGDFGGGTESAVKAFQAANGLCCWRTVCCHRQGVWHIRQSES